MLRPYLAGIPNYLKEHGLFCLWRYENGKKPPYQISGQPADVSSPETFAPFSEVTPLLPAYDGMGVLIRGGIGCIDLDHCIQGGKLSGTARQVLDMFQSYTEKSPRGEGIHIFFLLPSRFQFDADKYLNKNTGAGLEIYTSGRYMTCTGIFRADRPRDLCIVDPTPFLNSFMQRKASGALAGRPGPRTAPAASNVIGWTYRRITRSAVLSDDDLIQKAMTSKGGESFRRLWEGDVREYGSQSEADLALCSRLAYWTACDPERMDRLFRQSALMRDKWDTRRPGGSYGAQAIQKAISSSDGRVYDPGRR